MKESGKKISLYECASLFGESMHEKFPYGCDDSAILMVSTDGSKISSLIDGKDGLICQMIAQIAIEDEEVRDVLLEGLHAATQYLDKTQNGEDNATQITSGT